MASGSNGDIFNLALASLAAGASAFAAFAVPGDILLASIEAVGLASPIAFPVGATARFGAMAAAAAISFLLAWLALRSFDPPSRKPESDPDEDLGDDWFTQRLLGRSGSADAPATQPLFAERELDNPFAELARGAESIEGPLELRIEQIADEINAPANDDDEGPSSTELLVSMQPPVSDAGVAGLIQRLNAGLVEREWPLPSGDQEPTPAEVDDRLRSVLRDLRAMTRGA